MLASLTAGLLLAACPAAALFGPPGIPLEAESRGLTVADWTGEGVSDWAVVVPASDRVQMRLRDGAMEWTTTVSTADQPIALLAADLDAVPGLDLVVLHNRTGVSLYSGRGNGQFSAPTRVELPGYISSWALADLNRDGATDIIVGFSNSTSALHKGAFLLSNGAGGLGRTPLLIPGWRTDHAAAGDFNLDGRPEVVYDDGDRNRLFIYTTTNSGTVARIDTIAAPRSDALTVVDLDEDGRLDMIRSKWYLSQYHALHRGRAAAGFAPPETLRTAPSGPFFLRDLDGDGRLDWVNVQGASGFIKPFRGIGNVTFQAAGGVLWHEDQFNSVVAVRWDEDSLTDLLVVDVDNRYVSVKSAITPFSWQGPVPVLAFGKGYIQEALWRDFDGDGLDDVAVLHTCYSCQKPGRPPTGGLSLYRGDGRGQFTPSWSWSGSPNSTFQAIDIDGDRFLDLAVNASGGMLTFRNNHSGGFEAPRQYGWYGSARPAVFDFDGDGHDDLVRVDGTGFTVMRNDGSGGLLNGETIPTPGPVYDLVLGDLDADGHADLAAMQPTIGRVDLFRGNADGTFDSLGVLPPLDKANSGIIADFDGDGRNDLAVAGASPGRIILYPGAPGSGFLPPITSIVGGEPWSLVAADFDQDGRLDLAYEDRSTKNVVVAVGTAEGTFVRAAEALGPRHSSSSYSHFRGNDPFLVADFDGNGVPDIVSSRVTGGSLVVTTNLCAPRYDPESPPDVLLSGQWVTQGVELSWSVSAEFAGRAFTAVVRSRGGPPRVLNIPPLSGRTHYTLLDSLAPYDTLDYSIRSRSGAGFTVESNPVRILLPAPVVEFSAGRHDSAVVVSWLISAYARRFDWTVWRGAEEEADRDLVGGPLRFDSLTGQVRDESAGRDSLFYWIECLRPDGVTVMTGPLFVPPVGSGPSDPPGPDATRIRLISPNPALGDVTFAWSATGDAMVRITVFDVVGRRRRRLLEDAPEPGIHLSTWNLRDDQGLLVPSGAYFLMLEDPAGRHVISVTVVR